MLGTPLRFNPFEPTLSLSFITHVNFTLNLVQEYLYPCPLDLVEHFAKFYDDVMKTKCGGGRIDLSIVGGEKENSILIAEKKKILADKEEIWTLSLYCEMGGLKTKLFGLCPLS